MINILLIPMGNKVKWKVLSDVYCTRESCLLLNSQTVVFKAKNWVDVFGTKTESKKFMKKGKSKIVQIRYLQSLGYSYCDIIV